MTCRAAAEFGVRRVMRFVAYADVVVWLAKDFGIIMVFFFCLSNGRESEMSHVCLRCTRTRDDVIDPN